MKRMEESPAVREPELGEAVPAGGRESGPDNETGKVGGSPKKLILALSVAALAALIAVGVTMAFVTRTVEVDNVITFGSVRMRVLETEAVAGDGGQVVERPVENGESIRVGAGVMSRIVRVENAGGVDALVRIRPVVEAVTEQGDRMPAGACAVLAMNEGEGASQWTRGGDGWWYCNATVRAQGAPSGSVTAPVMTGIEFVGDYPSLVGPGGSFVLTVEAQAVQAPHNAERAIDAQGWPSDKGADE